MELELLAAQMREKCERLLLFTTGRLRNLMETEQKIADIKPFEPIKDCRFRHVFTALCHSKSTKWKQQRRTKNWVKQVKLLSFSPKARTSTVLSDTFSVQLD